MLCAEYWAHVFITSDTNKQLKHIKNKKDTIFLAKSYSSPYLKTTFTGECSRSEEFSICVEKSLLLQTAMENSGKKKKRQLSVTLSE